MATARIARPVAGLNVFIVVLSDLAILALLLVGIEFTARFIQGRRLGPNAYHPATFMDRWTGWRNAPGYQRIDIHHNAQGFRRTRDTPLVKPRGVIRIFLLGGSTAYGSEGLFAQLDPDWKRLDDRDLIDAYLERLLQKNHPERRWEVINAATNEFRMHQHLALISAKLLAFKPDFVIFLDGHNDLSGIMAATHAPYDPYEETPHNDLFMAMVYPHSLASLFLINSAWLRNNSVAWSMITNRLGRLSPERAFAGGPDANRPEPVPIPVKLSDLDPPLQKRAAEQMTQAPYYVQMAKRLNNALEYEGIPALFAMQPELILSHKHLTDAETRFADFMRKVSGRYTVYMYENLRPEISRQMVLAAQEKGFTFADLVDVFDDTAEKTFTDYCHLTPKGNELVAERLYQAMEPQILPKLINRSGK